MLECCSFFHDSMMDVHLVDCNRNPWILRRQYLTPVVLWVARYMVATTGIFRLTGIGSTGVRE